MTKERSAYTDPGVDTLVPTPDEQLTSIGFDETARASTGISSGQRYSNSIAA
jgi:hypothetical protein